MTVTIALAGKGGTGKTTIAALLIKYLLERKAGPVLAIDADPSSNLHSALGLPLDGTVGDIREDLLAQVSRGETGGVSKKDQLEYEIQRILVEGRDVDLLAMGRPEGRGCYCAVNNVLRLLIDQMGKSYLYVVMDNEAGMEHLSRRTTRDVDFLLITTDPTVRGITAAGRIARLGQELEIGIARTHLVINRLNGELPLTLRQAVAESGIVLLGTIPHDPALAEFEVLGRPLVELGNDSVAYQAVKRMVEEILVLLSKAVA